MRYQILIILIYLANTLCVTAGQQSKVGTSLSLPMVGHRVKFSMKAPKTFDVIPSQDDHRHDSMTHSSDQEKYQYYQQVCARMYHIDPETVSKCMGTVMPIGQSVQSIELNIAAQAGNLDEVIALTATHKYSPAMLRKALLFAHQEYHYSICRNLKPLSGQMAIIEYVRGILRRQKSSQDFL